MSAHFERDEDHRTTQLQVVFESSIVLITPAAYDDDGYLSDVTFSRLSRA